MDKPGGRLAADVRFLQTRLDALAICVAHLMARDVAEHPDAEPPLDALLELLVGHLKHHESNER